MTRYKSPVRDVGVVDENYRCFVVFLSVSILMVRSQRGRLTVCKNLQHQINDGIHSIVKIVDFIAI